MTLVNLQSCSTLMVVFFFSSRRRHTRCSRDWSSDVCSSDLLAAKKLTFGLWQVPHDAVHVGSEPLDVPARHDAPPVAARRATLLNHHVTDEGGGEDSAIHQDAVDFDEALGKGSHGWVFSIHSTGST